MNHFLQLAAGLDITPLLYALHRQPWLWNADPVRSTFPGSPHHAVSDILLHFNTGPAYSPRATAPTSDSDHECSPYPAWWALPEARALIFPLLTAVHGTRLGRVMITSLPAGAEIPPHIDSKAQTDYYTRHHIILAHPQWDCWFLAGQETVCMRPGECWAVDNSVLHGVVNHGDTARLSLIVDIHSPHMAGGGG